MDAHRSGEDANNEIGCQKPVGGSVNVWSELLRPEVDTADVEDDSTVFHMPLPVALLPKLW
ncbi:Uncharacterized protein APZ42_020227 [Daphnia magna]|uniref:Uncharacterized protein n=1 Tax=Daphnia magna TaxID=35525 RepID=A0A0P5LYI3_9CRUS|nr:Uncharacterized protein APZ42_020227 [Daphnia magna]